MSQPPPTSSPRVPWTGPDVFLLFLTWLFLMHLAAGLAWFYCESTGQILETSTTASEIVAESTEPASGRTREHPVTLLMMRGIGSPWVLLVPFFCAVIAAPLTEEFLYRLVLQRWLESVGNDFQRFLGREMSSGVFSITITSLLFAVAHAGTHRDDLSPDLLYYMLLGVALANLSFLALALCYLRFLRQATWADLGLADFKPKRDILLPLLLVAGAVPYTLALQYVLKTLGPQDVQTDPIPLFLLALLLGTLLHRTNRILPCVMLHAFFNASSFFLVLALLMER